MMIAPLPKLILTLLTRFSLQTGIAIDNSRLYEQLERRLQRENLINKFLRRLSSKLNLPSIVNDIMVTAMRISEADLASFILLDSVDSGVYIRYIHDATNLSVTRQKCSYSRHGCCGHRQAANHLI